MSEDRNDYVSRRDLKMEVDDIRDESGVEHAKMLEAWRTELQLQLKSFRYELRLLLVGALALAKFDIPQSITLGAVAIAAVGLVAKVAFGFFSPS